jgi:hypothetical protein
LIEIFDMEKIYVSTAAIVVLQGELNCSQSQVARVCSMKKYTMTLSKWNTRVEFGCCGVAEHVDRGVWIDRQAH